MLRKFLNNCKKPQGRFGKIVLSAMNAGHAPLSKWALEKLVIEDGMAMLDVGCGGGGTIERILKAHPACRVDGVDYSEASVQKSEEKLRRFGDKCRIYCGDACDLPCADESYDIVVTFESVYFWSDPLKGMQEIFRVLKDGGKVLVATEMCDPEKGKFWTERCENMTIYTSSQLKAFVEEAGFSEIVVHGKKETWCAVEGTKNVNKAR